MYFQKKNSGVMLEFEVRQVHRGRVDRSVDWDNLEIYIGRIYRNNGTSESRDLMDFQGSFSGEL